MNRLLFSLSRRFSSTCNKVREVARLLRLVVNSRKPAGFCHIPKVWLRYPDTCKPFNQPFSADAPPACASGKTGATIPVMVTPSAVGADDSPAIDFPAQSPSIASAIPSDLIFFLTLPDE